MPVRNAMPYLTLSIESILAQTHVEFEFVIVDDCSTDGSSDILAEYARKDGRIRLFREESWLGAVGSSNAAVHRARASIVARMDADDVAKPERLERQLHALSNGPDLVLLGSLAEVIDAEGRVVRKPDFHSLTRNRRFAPFPHSSIMFRKDAFERAGGYRQFAERWEDVDLYPRMLAQGEVATIAAPLVAIRFSPVSSRLRAGEAAFATSMDRMYRSIAIAAPGYRTEQPTATRGRIYPMAFVTAGSPMLWSGKRPSVMKPLLRLGDLGANLASGRALVWALCAQVAPRIFRGVLQILLALRNRGVRGRLPNVLVPWHPPGTGRLREAAND